MIREIIEGIASALDKEFGDSYTIYSESTEQGLQEPCFFISCVSPSVRRFLGNRFFRQSKFAVTYIPKSTDAPRLECVETAERLFCCLEIVVSGGDMIRGSNMSYEISDDVLVFFVNYDLFTKNAESAEEIMEGIELKNGK